MIINKNKLKWVITPLPLITLWFWFAQALGFGEDKWWAFPFFVTAFFCILGSLFLTLFVVSKTYREKRTDESYGSYYEERHKDN